MQNWEVGPRARDAVTVPTCGRSHALCVLWWLVCVQTIGKEHFLKLLSLKGFSFLEKFMKNRLYIYVT